VSLASFSFAKEERELLRDGALNNAELVLATAGSTLPTGSSPRASPPQPRLATASLATDGRLQQQSRCPDSFLLSRKEQLAALAPRSRHFAIRKGEKITCTIDWDGQEARLITDRAMRRLVRSEIPLPPLFIERIIKGSPRTGIS
jgi:hypothetical protein